MRKGTAGTFANLALGFAKDVGIAVQACPVGAAFAELCGPDAVLRECSAVVSAPGSPPQPCHSDTKWTEDLVLATCFVALQDIGPELGPTRFLPDTATSKAHALLADALAAPDAAAAVVAYAETVSQLAVLDAGDATLYESRLQHAGTCVEIVFFTALSC